MCAISNPNLLDVGGKLATEKKFNLATINYRKILKLAIIFEVTDSIFQKIVKIDFVYSQPMLYLNYIRAYKYTSTGRRDGRLLVLN